MEEDEDEDSYRMSTDLSRSHSDQLLAAQATNSTAEKNKVDHLDDSVDEDRVEELQKRVLQVRHSDSIDGDDRSDTSDIEEEMNGADLEKASDATEGTADFAGTILGEPTCP